MLRNVQLIEKKIKELDLALLGQEKPASTEIF